DGAVLGAGVPLRAGQRLSVDRGVVRTDPLGADEAGRTINALLAAPAARPAAPAPAAAVAPEGPPAVVAPAGTTAVVPSGGPPPAAPESESAPARTRAVDDGDWLVLAKHGAYGEAFTAAKRAGWGRLCHRLDAHRLLTLGDVARYAGARARA